ncbi:hypothetical protein KJ909_00290 [Patescibacteria group bacterium]|nr:hypothetical protein [Patescibacteria group bacterium]
MGERDIRICRGKISCPVSSGDYCPLRERIYRGWRSTKGRKEQVKQMEALLEQDKDKDKTTFLRQCTSPPW